MTWYFLGWLITRLRRLRQLRVRIPQGISLPGMSHKAAVPCATIDLIGAWVNRAGTVLREGEMSIDICHDVAGGCLHDTDGRQLLAVLVFTDEGMERCFTPADILQALSTGSLAGAREMMFIFVPQATLADRKASMSDSITFVDASLVTLGEALASGEKKLELAAA